MEIEKPTYDFHIENIGAKCSCSCPCNPSNPVDVSVTFSREGVKQMVTLGPEHVKKLS